MIDALLKTGGMKSRAAKILGCDVGTITNRQKEFPAIEAALTEAESRRLDEAETMLDKNIKKGNERAIEFFLSKKGKSRGYAYDKEEEEMDLATVIETFQKGLEEAKPEFPKQVGIEVAPNE